MDNPDAGAPENAQDLTIFVQNLLEQMVSSFFLCGRDSEIRVHEGSIGAHVDKSIKVYIYADVISRSIFYKIFASDSNRYSRYFFPCFYC